MATLRTIIKQATSAKSRRAGLKTLADPMELARLAIALKPELASGTSSQQREALMLAKAFFNRAADVSAEQPTAEKRKTEVDKINADVWEAVRQELGEGTYSYDPEGKGEDELQSYLSQQKIKVPKTYKDNWETFLKKFGFEIDGQWQVAKKAVKGEVKRLKRQAADHKALRRASIKSGKNRSSE